MGRERSHGVYIVASGLGGRTPLTFYPSIARPCLLDAPPSRGMTGPLACRNVAARRSGSFCQNRVLGFVSPKRHGAVVVFCNRGIVVPSCIVEPCGSVAARRIPAGCRPKLSFEPFAIPKRGKRSAEIRGRGSPHPSARPYDRTCPSSGREQPAHNADQRAFRRPTAAFSLDLGTAFWKRTGAPIRTPLIPRGFPAFIRSTSPLPDGPM